MKTPPLSIPLRVKLFFLLLALPQIFISAQMQWYQNQDGNSSFPYGTYASTINEYSSNTFIACYQWQVVNDTYTWKISKTNTGGTELRTFFVSGIMANAEVRVMKNGSVYVLAKMYPDGQSPQYTVYRLNSNLQVAAQRNISFPGAYTISSLNAFEIDDDGNVYLAGDGQFPDGSGGFGFASFVLKTGKNLANKWSRMDSAQTSYTRLHVDRSQRVMVVADYYLTYPAVKIIRINKTGTDAVSTMVVPDSMRYSVNSMLDRNDNLILYGGKMVSDTSQGSYFCKVSRNTGAVLYRKTLFEAPVSILNDVKQDNNGRLFVLATQYYSGELLTKISRMNPDNGGLMWSQNISFNTDRCLFNRLVVNDDNRFFAVGEQRSGDYFAKGFALRISKSGQTDGRLPAPDSVSYQRYHTLWDGIIDNNKRLVAIGNTNDFDTTTYSSTYYRAFAVRMDDNQCEHTSAIEKQATGEEGTVMNERLQLYPNPVQSTLVVSNMNTAVYDRLYVYNMQGAVVMQRQVSTSTASLDLSNFTDGVYLLVFRSSQSLKEKTVKFVVSK